MHPMLPGATFAADVVLVAPKEQEITRAQRTYREKNFTTFTELLAVNAFQTHYIRRINEALGLEALAAYLREAGLSVALINCNVAPHTPRELARKIEQSGAKVVGISLIYRPQVGHALDLLEALRDVRGIHVSMGGALASYMPRELLSRLERLDSIVYGESEETFCDHCQLVIAGGAWRAARGIAFRDGDRVVVNPAAAPLDLACIRAPARDTLAYLRARGWPTRIASIYTSRGCMARCTFCTGKDVYNVERTRTYRFRDPVHVVDEIEHLVDEFGVRFVYINDDNFLGYGRKSDRRVRKFAEEILDRKLSVQFATECRVDALDLDVLRLLREAGMRQVLLGIESGSESTLLRWRKGATREQNASAIATIQVAGVALEPGFIMFDAHTTQAELAENLVFIRETKLHTTAFPAYLINRLSVYPGTEIERQLTADGTLAPSPIPARPLFQDAPEQVIQYFQRLEYVCRDPRTELVWRALRAEIEQVEVFLEDQLPGITSVLTANRGTDAGSPARAMIRRARQWRAEVGGLVLNMLQACVDSYAIESAAAQYRWLRGTLRQLRTDMETRTLACSTEVFVTRALEIRRAALDFHVAVVIPTAGKWSRLTRTLRCLATQEKLDDIRWCIVLVADGVEVPPELIGCFGLEMQCVQLPARRGRGAARNAGIASVNTETIILLDDDMLVGPGFVRAHLDAQRTRGALVHGPIRELLPMAYVRDLDTGELEPGLDRPGRQGRIEDWLADVRPQLDHPELLFQQRATTSRIERDGTLAYEQGRMPGCWVAFAGANLSAPKRWFIKDGFDERPGTRWGLEDVALSLRWLLCGRPLDVASDARAVHLTHYREQWRDAQRANLLCLDFLPGDLALHVVEYMEGARPLADVERALAPLVEAARRDGLGAALAAAVGGAA
jgi:methylmalonyl-CoA mutase cobalamin-binding subunit